MAFSGRQFLILGVIHHIGDCEDVLLIVGFDRMILRDDRSYRKLIGRSGVYPFADHVGFGCDLRKTINGKAVINVCGLDCLCPIFLDKGNRINNFISLFDNSRK